MTAHAVSRSLLPVSLLVSLLAACVGDDSHADRTGSPPPASPPASSSPSEPAAPPVADGVVSTQVAGYPIGLAAARDGGVWAVATQAGTVRHLTVGAQGEAHVDRATPVGAIPLRAADTADGLWVSVFGDGVLRRLGPRPARLGAVDEPEGLAVSDDRLWVVDQLRSEALELRLPAGDLIRRVEVGLGPRLVHAGPSGVWVSSYDDGSVTRVDTPRAVTRSVCDGPQGLTEAAGRLWVACSLQDRLVGLDPRTLRPEVRLDGLTAVDAVASTPDAVLALLPDGPTLVVVDPADGTEQRRLRLAQAPPVSDGNVDLLVHRDRVWASSPLTDEVLTLPLARLP